MLLIHTALHVEANALIRHFKLKRQHNEHAFACFMADNIWLIESGVGKNNAAAAVAWLSAKVQTGENSTQNPVWLNIGLAGHANLALGNLARVNRIEDHATAQRWYPPDSVDNSPQGYNLLCVDQEVVDYPDNSLVDMETSGFIQAASRFSTLELIQSLKIVSDNRENPPQRFKKQQVDDWINPHLESIDQYTQQLMQLRRAIVDNSDSENQLILKRTHFSQYQKTTLHRLVQRYQALYPDQRLSDKLPADLLQARTILTWLETSIEQAVIRY